MKIKFLAILAIFFNINYEALSLQSFNIPSINAGISRIKITNKNSIDIKLFFTPKKLDLSEFSFGGEVETSLVKIKSDVFQYQIKPKISYSSENLNPKPFAERFSFSLATIISLPLKEDFSLFLKFGIKGKYSKKNCMFSPILDLGANVFLPNNFIRIGLKFEKNIKDYKVYLVYSKTLSETFSSGFSYEF